MRKLKRSECAVLHLVLKKKWYDMIASGEKREEYRGETLYWSKRITNWMKLYNSRWNSHLVVAFSLGYAKPSMWFKTERVIRNRFMFRTHGRPERGDLCHEN